MEKWILIAGANFRRAKGQTAAIALLVLLAAFMLNLWLMLSTDYKKNFDRYHDKLHAEHVTLALNDNRDAGVREFLSETLEKDGRTVQYCMDDGFFMAGSFSYHDGEVNTEFIILDKETAENRTIGAIELLGEDDRYQSGIYLPMLYRSDEKLAVGETVEITIGSQVKRYTVCGFLNSVMAGSHNCSMSALVLTGDKYEELEREQELCRSTLVSVRIRDKKESQEFEADLKEAVSARYPEIRTQSNSYTLVSSSRYISQMICSGIMSVMAFFVTLIALVVIASNVIHYIQGNMKNLGALKAVGYESGQIVGALLFQFSGLALMAALPGIGLSYCLFPAVNDMMISQTGIPYAVHFLPLPFFLALITVAGTVFLTVWLSARRIRKIEPITALREGIRTHSFRKNHIPLEKTRLSLSPALAMKTTLSGMKQNVTLCITMLALSLVVVFSGLMVENVIMDMEPFINMIVGETADSCININAEAEEEFLRRMRADGRVEKVYLYNSTNALPVGGIGLMATVTDDFKDVNNQDVCVEGRYPRYDNEIAVAAKYAREQGLDVGDEIRMTAEGKEETYLICGLTQMSNNLGRDCLFTRSGYERIGTLGALSYYINLAEGVDVEAFQEETGAWLKEDMNAAVNILDVLEGTGRVYVSLMGVLVAAILVLSTAVILFVLYLLVRAMLDRKKQEYGILKALGFTTGQLVLQTALSFMPAVILSMTAGLIVSVQAINPLIALFLSRIGIVKCTFRVPVGFVTAAGGALCLMAFALACLLSLKIRKITPKELFTGE